MTDIKCRACGDEGGPHGLIGGTLLCEPCLEMAEAMATVIRLAMQNRVLETKIDFMQYARTLIRAAVKLNEMRDESGAFERL